MEKIIKTKLIVICLIAKLVILSTWCCMPSSYSLPANNVIPLVNDQYFLEVHRALRKAKQSIFCVMYLAKLSTKDESSFINTLIRDLIKAHRRGVDVKVIFDQNVRFWENSWRKNMVERKSRDAYKRLLNAGVSVYYDSREQITHSKIIVIDNYITIVGSANWTFSAMNRNNEASVLIESNEVAEEFIRRLRLIPREKVQE